MEKLLVVDGHNLLFQMFFGIPGKVYGRNQQIIHGTLGFISTIKKVYKMLNATKIIVLFDGETSNFRKEINPDYKANRPSFEEVLEEDNPFSQLKDIFKTLEYLKIKYFETIDCEADDIIASYAHKSNMETYILSNDTDFLQLINKRVFLYVYRGKKTVIYNCDLVKEKYGINPENYLLFKALVGDNADNIAGIPLIGKVTAAALINRYHNLDNLLENIEELKPKIKESILKNLSTLQNNLTIIQLDGCKEIPYQMDELGWSGNDENTFQILREMMIA